jgi:hypothetical protein
MRATIHNQLIGDPTLTALIPAERWFQAGAVLDRPRFPFAVVRWIAPVSGAALGTFLNQLRIDVHDARGDYTTIDRVLGAPWRTGGVYGNLSALVDFTGADGRIVQCDYLGDSGDQEDTDYNSNFKYSSWQVIGRNL